MTTKPTLLIDVEKYQHYLDDYNLSDSEKKEFLDTIRNMVCEFVFLGFNVHPLQDISGDKTADSSAFTTLLPHDMLSSDYTENMKEGAEE